MRPTSIIIAALLPLFTTVLGAPATVVRRDVPGNVYICNDNNWQTNCSVLSVGIDNCMRLPEPYFENVGSIGPDRGAICRLFDGTAQSNPCAGSGLSILFHPGKADLTEAKTKARYIRCQTCTNCN